MRFETDVDGANATDPHQQMAKKERRNQLLFMVLERK